MNEKEIRGLLREIDERKTRIRVLTRMAQWPMFVPSSVKADKKRGIFRYFGLGSSGALDEIEMSREERSEFRGWLLWKADRLTDEVADLSNSLENGS